MANEKSIEEKYYIGNGKKLFKIQKLINSTNLSPEEKEMIIDEYNKISLSSQDMRFQLNSIIQSINNITK